MEDWKTGNWKPAVPFSFPRCLTPFALPPVCGGVSLPASTTEPLRLLRQGGCHCTFLLLVPRPLPPLISFLLPRYEHPRGLRGQKGWMVVLRSVCCVAFLNSLFLKHTTQDTRHPGANSSNLLLALSSPEIPKTPRKQKYHLCFSVRLVTGQS